MTWLPRILVLGVALMIGAAPAYSATKRITQKPCDPGAGFCKFISAGNPIPTIRKITLNAPGKGTANVSFNGSLVCSSDLVAGRTVDFASQITDKGNATADPAAPGGLRLGAMFAKDQGLLSMNMASSRLFKVSGAGKKKYYLRLTPLQMDTSTSCYIYNAVFTVEFAS